MFGRVDERIRHHVPNMFIGELVDAIAATHCYRHEPHIPQRTQVLRHQRLGHLQLFGKFTHASTAVEECDNELQSPSVPEHVEDAGSAINRRVLHASIMTPYMHILQYTHA